MKSYFSRLIILIIILLSDNHALNAQQNIIPDLVAETIEDAYRKFIIDWADWRGPNEIMFLPPSFLPLDDLATYNRVFPELDEVLFMDPYYDDGLKLWKKIKHVRIISYNAVIKGCKLEISVYLQPRYLEYYRRYGRIVLFHRHICFLWHGCVSTSVSSSTVYKNIYVYDSQKNNWICESRAVGDAPRHKRKK